MSLVLILTCGTSILDRRPDARTTTDKLIAWARREQLHTNECPAWPPRAGVEVLLPEGEGRRGELVLHQPGQPMDEVSAEMAGLESTAGRHPYDDARVVLLASETADGLLAALLNGFHVSSRVTLHPGVPGTVAECVIEWGTRPERDVHVVRVPALDVGDQEGFATSLEHLARVLVWAMREVEDPSLVVHLAGGFKPTVPGLYALCEYVYPVLGEPPAVYCKHEMSRDAIKLPTRTIAAGAVRGLSEHLRSLQSGERPESRFLEYRGAMFDENGLLPLGRGVLAMLDASDAPTVLG